MSGIIKGCFQLSVKSHFKGLLHKLTGEIGQILFGCYVQGRGKMDSYTIYFTASPEYKKVSLLFFFKLLC